MRGGMQHHRVHTVVVFLMKMVLQMCCVQYNECQGMCLVSTDTRTYRQVCTSGSKTDLRTFVLTEGEEVTV